MSEGNSVTPEGLVLTFIEAIVVVLALLAMAGQRGRLVAVLLLVATAILVWGPALT